MTSQLPFDSHEIRPLTGVRGLAALAVVGFHFYGGWLLLFPSLRLAHRLFQNGWIGVDLFFTLSGFILSYVYHVGGRTLSFAEYRRFLWFRLARIYPNHVATLGVLMVFVFVAKCFHLRLTGYYGWPDLPFQLTLTQQWPISPIQAVAAWNFPAWSISAEWFAYLCIFPLAVSILPRFRSPAAMVMLGTLLMLVWPTLSYFIGNNEWTLDRLELVQVSCEFLAGAFFFRVFLNGGPLVRTSQQFLSALFLAATVLYCFAPAPYLLPLLPFLLLGLTSDVSLIGRIFSAKPMLWLGRISYALYMSHALALKLLKTILPEEKYAHYSLEVRLLVFVAYLAVILSAAIMLYYVVEVPARNYLRKWRPAKHVAQTI